MSGVDWPALVERAQRLLADDQTAAARALLQSALQDGGPSAPWRLLALALCAQGRYAESLAILRRVVDAEPGNLDARFELAETLLLLGDFDAGWREYRFRYRLSYTRQLERKVQQARWDGRPLPGATLLIHAEQGYGDTLQFLRLVERARRQSGARVVLEVMPELLSLARRVGGYDEIIARGELPPRFDRHCELLGLPMALKLQLAELPATPSGTMPYLVADPARLEKWRRRLADLPRPWVALVWAGRPEHNNDRRRSLRLVDFAPLARRDMSFVALQKGPAAGQAADPPPDMALQALDTEIADFEDSAAILTLADLLISVDSSPVHLAGALGRPAWVLLPFVPDWRWLVEREDSPWYPSLRLFRQPAPGDWAAVLDRLAVALNDWRAAWR